MAAGNAAYRVVRNAEDDRVYDIAIPMTFSRPHVLALVKYTSLLYLTTFALGHPYDGVVPSSGCTSMPMI